jgi:hypothetical protein
MAAAADPYAAFADPAPAPSGSASADPYSAFADPAPPVGTTAAGAVNALATGINSGVLGAVGIPVDTMSKVIELGKAGAGFLYHETTGNVAPDWLQPSTAPAIGGSEWLKQKVRDAGGSSVIDPYQNTATTRIIHGAGEAVPASLVGGEASVPAAIRSAAAGAAAGAAQQGAADAGLPTAGQAAVGFLAGAAAGRATAARQPAAPSPRPATVDPTGGFSVKPSDVPGEAPQINVGGRTTAADQGVTQEFAPPTQEGSTQAAAPTPEQEVRAQTLRDVGLTEARESAITGDTKEAGTDFQTSKVDNAPGDRMSDVVANERGALQSYAGQLRDNSAGTGGLTSTDNYARGQTIAKPVEQLRDWFDDQTTQQYAAADARAQGVPIDLPATQQALADRASFLGTVDGKQLREGVQARMRDLGLMDEGGNVQGGTVKQAEQLKQYLNNQWSPQTGRLIGQLKNAIDDDVTKAAGSDIYGQARTTRAQRSALLDDPTGIAKLAPPEDRLGINRSVPLEQVPDYVTSLPVDQFKHVVGTLRGMPTIAPGATDIHVAATNALNEIRAHFANRVEAAGNSTQNMWNAKAVNNYLSQNQMRMAHVFSPEEIRQFKTLNDAGNILRMDRSYPGAAAQEYNLRTRGVLAAGKLVGKVGGAAGLVAGHGLEGGATGHVIAKGAEKGAAKLAERSMLVAVEKRIRKL